MHGLVVKEPKATVISQVRMLFSILKETLNNIYLPVKKSYKCIDNQINTFHNHTPK